MVTLFLTKLLANGLLVLPLIVQAHPFHSESSSVAINGTLIEPRLYQKFRIKDCNSANTNVIEAALGEIPQVLERTAERLDELITALLDPTFNAREDLSDEDWSTLDTFGVLYGNLLSNRGKAKNTATPILSYYLRFVSLMQNKVSDIAAQNLDITCNSDWAKETDNNDEDFESVTGSDGTDYYYDDSGNELGWVRINQVCQKVPELEGFTLSISSDLIVESENTLISITAICAHASSRATFSTALTTLRDNTYTESDSLQGLASDTATFLLLHELSHALSLAET